MKNKLLLLLLALEVILSVAVFIFLLLYAVAEWNSTSALDWAQEAQNALMSFCLLEVIKFLREQVEKRISK